MQKLFEIIPNAAVAVEEIIPEVILSVEETFNLKKEIKKSDDLLTNITSLVNAVKKDVGLGLTNSTLFNVNPYKKYITNIDKILSKTYGLKLTHVAVDNTYSGYIKDSYLKDALVKSIFDKNKDNILTDIKDELPKVSNNKAKGKQEQALTVFIKADFLDIIVNHEMSDVEILNIMLSEIQMVLSEIENMNTLLSDGIVMRDTLKDGGIDKLYVDVLNGEQDAIDAVSGTSKMKLVIDAVIAKYVNANKYNSPHNPYHGAISNEDNDDGRTQIPIGTRISYFLLLVIVIAILVTIAAAGFANFVAIWYAILAYVAYTVFYTVFRLVHIITIGTDPKEVPEKKNTIVVVKDLLNAGNTDSINNADSDMRKSNGATNGMLGKISKLYNGKLSNEMMNISNESVFDQDTLNKLMES